MMDAMLIARIMERMVVFSEGNLRDVNHFMKVYGYARLIGLEEELTEEEQMSLEIAAIVHDIACPLCRMKYGNTDGKHQEEEGKLLARKLLEEMEVPEKVVERVVFLVGHHHTFEGVEGEDYQILIEADYLVNADESGYLQRNIATIGRRYFRTETGLRLLEELYGV